MDQITMLDAALKYAEMGLSVIPIKAKDKTPPPGFLWKPYQERIATEEEIRQWFQRWPDANLAIVTGNVSGIFALDFDSGDAINTWEAKFEDLPQTLHYKTGRGYQYLFTFDSYGEGNKTAIMEQVDIRGEGGYTIVPPSIHPNGNTYEWQHINVLEHGLDELAEMPAEMLAFCKEANKTPKEPTKQPAEAKPKTEKPKKKEEENPDWQAPHLPPPKRHTPISQLEWMQQILVGVKKGSRNAACAKLCGGYVREFYLNGIKREDMFDKIYPLLAEWNQRNEPPLPDNELRTTLTSIIGRHTFDTLSDLIKTPIYTIEVLQRKGGQDDIYIIYTTADKGFRVTNKELCSLELFRPKFLNVTKRFIPVMKPQKFYDCMQACLEDATYIEESEGNSPFILLKSHIMAIAPKNGNERVRLDRGPIILDGIVHITLQAAYDFMQTTSYKAKWEEVQQMLKALGFVYNKKQRIRIPFGCGWIKTWQTPLEDLMRSESYEEDEENEQTDE